MIYILAVIKDRAIQAYMQIFTTRAEGEAIRGFQDALNNEKSGNMYNHPDDFDLYVIGEYNDSTGEITPEKPRKIGDGKQLKTQGE